MKQNEFNEIKKKFKKENEKSFPFRFEIGKK
jgi:hypothetical protein